MEPRFRLTNRQFGLAACILYAGAEKKPDKHNDEKKLWK
jgi:hypothetical protein